MIKLRHYDTQISYKNRKKNKTGFVTMLVSYS